MSQFILHTNKHKTSFLGVAYSIVASCLCFGEGILLQTVVKVPACLPVFALLLVSCLQLRCWKISRTVWIYQDWTLLICICTYSWLMLKTISDGAFATLNWEGWTCSIDTKKMHQIFPSFIRLPTSLFCLFVYMNIIVCKLSDSTFLYVQNVLKVLIVFCLNVQNVLEVLNWETMYIIMVYLWSLTLVRFLGYLSEMIVMIYLKLRARVIGCYQSSVILMIYQMSCHQQEFHILKL